MTHPDDAFGFLVGQLRAHSVGDQQGKFDLVIEVAVANYLAKYDPPLQRNAGGWGRHADKVGQIWPLLLDAS